MTTQHVSDDLARRVSELSNQVTDLKLQRKFLCWVIVVLVAMAIVVGYSSVKYVATSWANMVEPLEIGGYTVGYADASLGRRANVDNIQDRVKQVVEKEAQALPSSVK